MCGFVGYIGPQIPNNIFYEMINSISHRGPDNDGFWKDELKKVYFAFKRLSILDTSHKGNQPMISSSGRYIIVYNGEIYNHLILRKEIETNFAFSDYWKSLSDTETLLVCLDKYGLEETLQKLEGMFAFAVYDKKDNLIILARDRIGEKPLYYVKYSNNFIFGSELKALKKHPNFKTEINYSSVELLLKYNFIRSPNTIYKDVYKVKPGTYMTFSLKNFHLTENIYWALKDNIRKLDNQSLNKDYNKEFKNLLSKTVKNQMISDVPIGVFLSGGIDSSLIASLMAENSYQPIKSFTVGFNEEQFNEAKDAKRVANYLNTNHTEIILDSNEALNVVAKLPDIYCEPFADSSQIPTYLISKATKKYVSVALSGDGGDELFGGYNKYKLVNNDFYNLMFLPKKIRYLLSKLIMRISVNKYDLFFKNLQKIKLINNIDNIGDKLHKYANILLLDNINEIYFSLIDNFYKKKSPINSDFFRNFTLIDLYSLPEFKSESEKMMYFDLIAYLPDDILCKVDRASMSVSLETRAPFLSHKVIEFALDLPLEKKLSKNNNKIILRETLSKILPDNIINTQKKGFAIPLANWLRGPLNEWAKDLLNNKDLRKNSYLDFEIYDRLFQDHLENKKNNEKSLWAFLIFLDWSGKNQC